MDIARKDLYERVWATPLRKLALEFGVSDVSLSKACRRYLIPKPPMGHWTLVEHGKGYPRPDLPAAPFGEVVSFYDEQSRVQKIAKRPLRKIEVPVDVVSAPQRIAPFALATASHLRKSRVTPSGHVFSGGASQFECKVGPVSIERAQGLLSALEEALLKVGARVVRGAERKPLSVDFDGQRVRFTLSERHTRTELPPNPKFHGSYQLKEYSYALTGELKIAIEGYFDGRKTWTDGVRSRLEAQLAQVLAGLVAAATALRNRARAMEDRRKQWEEQARMREEKEAQLRRRVQFRDAFAAEARGWHQHQEAAAYLAHLQATVTIESVPQASQDWMKLAEQAVQDLDPSGKRLALLEEGVPPGYGGPFGRKLVLDARAGLPS